MWNPKRLIFIHVLIALLLLLLFSPYTQGFVNAIDRAFFRFLNGNLEGHPHMQLFWSLANHKLADWFHDIVFLFLIIAAVLNTPKHDRIKKISRFLFCVLYIAFIIFFFNRMIFRENLDIVRLSPTIDLPDSIRLSKVFPELGIKDSSKQSFPGDHATTALLLAITYGYLANRKLAILGWAYGIFMCLPRLIAGAHWFSDIAIGSGCIALFCLSWAFYTPFAVHASSLLEHFLRRLFCKPQIN